MSKIAFVERSFQGQSLELIRQANEILAEYEAKGLRVTLRQLYLSRREDPFRKGGDERRA